MVISMSMEKQQQRKLIVTDVAIYWLYTDGSHRCLDVGDAFLINAALQEYDIIRANKRTDQPVDKSCGEAWIEFSQKARMDNWSVYEDHAQIIQDVFEAGWEAKSPKRESVSPTPNERPQLFTMTLTRLNEIKYRHVSEGLCSGSNQAIKELVAELDAQRYATPLAGEKPTNQIEGGA